MADRTRFRRRASVTWAEAADRRSVGLTFHGSAAEMVPVCDVVTINAPLHPETENLFDGKMVARMKRGAYLVNTARGKICNRDAIARALESGQLAGYAGRRSGSRSRRRRTIPGGPCPITA